MQTVWGVVAAILIALGVYFFASGGVGTQSPGSLFVIPNLDSIVGTHTGTTTEPGVVVKSKKISLTAGVERWYTNDARTFSFRLPDGFNAPDLKTGEPGVEGRYGILLHVCGVRNRALYFADIPYRLAVPADTFRQSRLNVDVGFRLAPAQQSRRTVFGGLQIVVRSAVPAAAVEQFVSHCGILSGKIRD